MLTKRKYILALVVAGLIFPAAALAAGAGGSSHQVAVGDAQVAPAPVGRSLDHFEQVIREAAKRIRANHQAAVRRERREKFSHLPGGVSIETLESIASCESGGDPTVVSSDGSYRGKYQFDYGTWESVGGHGEPAGAPAA